jgi:threonine synthase
LTRTSLQCRECKKEYDTAFKYICEDCFGPLDVKYDFPSISKDTFSNREHTYWRYFELLPIEDKSNIISINAGMTPLIKADKLGEKLGLNNLYIKNDSVNPTFSKSLDYQQLVAHQLAIWHQLLQLMLQKVVFHVIFLHQAT